MEPYILEISNMFRYLILFWTIHHLLHSQIQICLQVLVMSKHWHSTTIFDRGKIQKIISNFISYGGINRTTDTFLEATLFIPSCGPLLESRDIERFCDVVPTKNLIDNIKETDQCSQRVEKISGWGRGNSLLSSPSYSQKCDNKLEENEIISYFFSINEVNGKRRVNDSIQILKEISIVRNQDIEKSIEITLQESKQLFECLHLQKLVSAYTTDREHMNNGSILYSLKFAQSLPSSSTIRNWQ